MQFSMSSQIFATTCSQSDAQACVPVHTTLYFLTRTIVTLFLEFFTVPFYSSPFSSDSPIALFNLFLNTLTLIYFMYLIDNVAELRFVNRFIYAIKRIYTHTHTLISFSDFFLMIL